MTGIKEITHLTMPELEAGMDFITQSPKDNGILEMIVRRPAVNEREVLEEGTIDLIEGLVGDSWITRGKSHPDMQLNIMNSRVISLVAQDKLRWKLAGDQLYIDFDLSENNLPPGSQLSIGEAVIEVTAEPHNGCKKFVQRFGKDAVLFVNSETGKQHHLRGLNAKVIQPGVIRVGDNVKKL